jgi:hypothetical protein
VVTLTALDDGSTELTVHEYGYPSAEIAVVSRAGMEQCIDKMASTRPGGRRRLGVGEAQSEPGFRTTR